MLKYIVKLNLLKMSVPVEVDKRSKLEKFRETYSECLDGFVDCIYVKDWGVQFQKERISQCRIRQLNVSKPRTAFLIIDQNLNVPPVGIREGDKVSFFAINFLDKAYNGNLVALLNHNTGREYISPDDSFNPGSLNWKYTSLKWQDVQEPL